MADAGIQINRIFNMNIAIFESRTFSHRPGKEQYIARFWQYIARHKQYIAQSITWQYRLYQYQYIA